MLRGTCNEIRAAAFLHNQQEKYGHLLHVRINRYFLNVFGFRLNTGKVTRATHREKNGERVLYTGD